MYLLTITICLVVAYFILYFLFPFFFMNETPRLTKRSWSSVFIIIILSFIGYNIVLGIHDLEFGNRVLHLFGGGFMAFLVCCLATQRKLPVISEGDFVITHDTGAHGIAMGFNYNGRLRPQELMLGYNELVCRIRRAETNADLRATLRGFDDTYCKIPLPKKG